MTIAEMRLPHKNMLNDTSLCQANVPFYYLLKIITNVIIKAIFMIVTPINPQNNRLIIANNAVSTIDTTSVLTVKLCMQVATRTHLLFSFPINITIQYFLINFNQTKQILQFYLLFLKNQLDSSSRFFVIQMYSLLLYSYLFLFGLSIHHLHILLL